eukprot:365377-Chlamydomonas_euryale.AAC.30
MLFAGCDTALRPPPPLTPPHAASQRHAASRHATTHKHAMQALHAGRTLPGSASASVLLPPSPVPHSGPRGACSPTFWRHPPAWLSTGPLSSPALASLRTSTTCSPRATPMLLMPASGPEMRLKTPHGRFARPKPPPGSNSTNDSVAITPPRPPPGGRARCYRLREAAQKNDERGPMGYERQGMRRSTGDLLLRQLWQGAALTQMRRHDDCPSRPFESDLRSSNTRKVWAAGNARQRTKETHKQKQAAGNSEFVNRLFAHILERGASEGAI